MKKHKQDASEKPASATADRSHYKQLRPKPAFSASYRRVAVWLAAGIAVVACAGFWAHHAVHESLQDIVAETLQTSLEKNVTAVRIWIENEKAFVESWAKSRRLSDLTAQLIDGTPHLEEEIRQILSPALTDSDFVGYTVVEPNGRVLAASRPELYVGHQVRPEFMPVLQRVIEGEVVFHPPVLKGTLLQDAAQMPTHPVIKIGAPVHNGHKIVIAALVFTVDPEQDFTRILSRNRSAFSTWHTYIFNSEGRLISESPFEEQLETLGLVPDTAGGQSILQVQIRDPGGDLTRGFRPASEIAQWPFTRAVTAALRGQSGIDTQGYRDYRGVRVIGAWQWLDEYHFGMATELAQSQIQQVLRPLRRAFGWMFALLAILAGVMLASWFKIHRLKQSIEEIKKVGPYTLVEKIGEGGMGRVYRADHVLLKRPCAVKLLKPDALGEESLTRFEREVQMTSRLTHPNTVEIYDYGRTPEGIFYYAMEYLPGLTLDQLIAMEGPVPPARVVHILTQICECLDEAHGTGLIHRDIKPLNIMVCERGGIFDTIKVLDFGLVKDTKAVDVELTSVHGLIGTPAYVAPERIADPLVNDPRSDIYSIGSVAFNLLTAQDVFEGATAVEIGYHILKTAAPRPSKRVPEPIPPALDQLVFDCLAKSPADRPQSVRDMLSVLQQMKKAEVGGRWTCQDARKWWHSHATEIRRLQGLAGA